MLLYSFSFLIFFTVVFVLYWKIPSKYQWVLLLAASYYFYASWKPAFLGLVILTTVVSYLCGIEIHRNQNKKKFYLVLALAVNLGILVIFKYFNFFSVTLQQLTGLDLPQFKLLLPIGISFYTLQVIGYLIDVYRGKSEPETHIGIFALFVCFFPQLSAGPIERSATLLPQLKTVRTFDYLEISGGLKLFVFGLFKKMVIADNIAVVVDRVYGALPEFKGLSLLLVIFLYSIQIYMDFSGYTDMARGVARMLGIKLLENFNFPYFSTSLQNFWRRWHISLSSWFRDYLYIPLGGNRNGMVRLILITLVVFVVSGLWHGAGITFMIWGLLHGMGISIERIAKKLFAGKVELPQIVKMLYTFVLVSFFWIFFRAANFQDALYIVQNMFVGARSFLSVDYAIASVNQIFVFNNAEIIITGCIVVLAIVLEIIQKRITVFTLVDRQPAFIRYVVYSILVFMIFQLRNAHIKEFIYVTF
jgi:alginate O-acetyltransferase complex protein AlgI